ncbi:response regulator [Flavobacterium sp. MK4S-17]|jgi:CheY-like chemotaxis protein|uniref:response regulator n=1 Tax=Flavobacterium sp. MK4S-17 TaxID=2543737 RepID=UPI00135A9ECB|nr:response regulator [Flavobacterium sp. MK4S-17]
MEHNILLIDDDVDEFIFITSVKEHFPSVSFHYAKCATNALKMMQAKLPDIVMLDINMPAVNGLQCLENIKKDPLLANATVVIYSTSVSPDVREYALKKGAAYCIEKPASIDDIKNTIEKILKVTGIYNKL